MHQGTVQSSLVPHCPNARSVVATDGLELTHEFVIFDIQENKFWPEMCPLSGFDDLRVDYKQFAGVVQVCHSPWEY